MFELTKKPELRITDIIGVFLIYIGVLFLLVLTHILAINNTGDTAAVLNTFFSIFLYFYYFACIMGVVAAIFQLFKWLTWSVSTPEWEKNKINKGGFN